MDYHLKSTNATIIVLLTLVRGGVDRVQRPRAALPYFCKGHATPPSVVLLHVNATGHGERQKVARVQFNKK